MLSVQESFQLDGYIDVKVRRWNKKKRKYGPWQWIEKHKHNLKTTVGLTFFLSQCYAGNSGGSIGTNGANFMGLTSTAITPAAGDTTLSGELSTNGLGRAQATVTIAQPTATITNTFTDTTATTNNIQGGALFTASSSGTMPHEFTFTSTNLGVTDQLQITVTVTGS